MLQIAAVCYGFFLLWLLIIVYRLSNRIDRMRTVPIRCVKSTVTGLVGYEWVKNYDNHWFLFGSASTKVLARVTPNSKWEVYDEHGNARESGSEQSISQAQMIAEKIVSEF